MDKKGKKVKKMAKENSKLLCKLRELKYLILQYEIERIKNSENTCNNLKSYNTLQKELNKEISMKDMLISIYKKAYQESSNEVELIKEMLSTINDIHAMKYLDLSSKTPEKLSEGSRRKTLMKMIYDSGASLPLWVGSADESLPHLCGRIPAEPHYIVKSREMVAALVKVAENEENWILAEILEYDESTRQYRVDDIHEEQSEHVLDREKVIPLPHYRANPLEHPSALFDKSTLVLALYPQTTCFYRALIHETPLQPEEPYQVVFEDRSYGSGYSPPQKVFQRYVLNFKENPERDVF